MDSHVPSNPAILLPLINYQRFGHLSLCQTKNLTFSTSLRLHQLKNSGSNSESNHAVKPSPCSVFKFPTCFYVFQGDWSRGIVMFCNWFGALNCFGRRDDPANQPHEQVVATKKFSFNSLRSATKDFHPSSKIGGGGYGVVHKGVLRDGTQVAIKSLSVESKQGTYEFMTEIDIISNIRHPNLVELIGCCIEDSHRILVYEFMENNSLASSLLGKY
ncbi:hypothetical protein ACSQ67_016351 [Phaseolus vulgaris]